MICEHAFVYFAFIEHCVLVVALYRCTEASNYEQAIIVFLNYHAQLQCSVCIILARLLFSHVHENCR